MKKYWYDTKKEKDILKIYYKLKDNEDVRFYQTQIKRSGNKKVSLIRVLMKNNWPIVTKKLTLLNPVELSGGVTWKEIDEEEILGYLRRGNPDDNARSSLFEFFGRSIFGLTDLELRYFKASFKNLPRLVAFYHVIKKECKSRGTGYTHRVFIGKSILITPVKIKKAMVELFRVDPQKILYNKEL